MQKAHRPQPAPPSNRLDARDQIDRSLRGGLKQQDQRTAWARRHAEMFDRVAAAAGEHSQKVGIVLLIRGLAEYADAHFYQCGTVIGEDYVLGPPWLAMGEGIRGLLDGKLGRLDGATLEALLLEVAEHNGYTEEDRRR
jgi:hypothetical protein